MSNSTPRAALPPIPPPAVKAGDYAGPPGEGASEDYWDAEQVEQIRRETVQACADAAWAAAPSDEDACQIAEAVRALLPVKSDSGHSAAADAGASTAPLPVRSPDSTAFWRDSVYPEGMTAEQVKAELDDFHFLMEQVPKVYMAVSGGLLSKPNYHAATVISAFEDYLTDRVNEEVAEALAGTGADTARHGQDDHAGSPAPSALPLFAVAVAQRKWEILQADGYRMQRIEFARSIDGQETRGIIDPWGRVLWKYGQAESSKAALSDDDARLSEDDLHARSWWCPTCKKDVPAEMVTKDGEHYLEAGGCGYAVRGELIEDQPKQPLSDEEIEDVAHKLFCKDMEEKEGAWGTKALNSAWLNNIALPFARAILARAGITRKPLTEEEIMDICKETSMLMWDEVDGYSIRGFARAIEAAHGITPQAGKESGDAS